MPPTEQQARRHQILSATERLVRHYGFQKTTVGDIAREAGIGVGSVYLEFDSKDAIVEELSKVRHGGVLAAMKAAALRDVSHERRLKDVMDARLEGFLRLADEGQHGSDLVHCTCPLVKDAHARFQAEEEALLAGLLSSGNRAGELSAKEPARMARVILAAYARFSVPWVFSLPRDEVLALHAGLHALVLKGLLKRA